MKISYIPPFLYKLKRHSDSALFVALGLLAFYLAAHYSKDWEGNKFWYYINKQTTWGYLQQGFSPFNEQLYKFISKNIGALIGFNGFVLTATITLLFIKLRFLGAIVGGFFVGTFFYVCLYLLLFEGTIIRAGFATALIFPALYFLKTQRYAYAFLLVILSSQIHLSALVFLAVFPLYFFRRLNWLIYILFLLSPIFIILDISLLDVFKQSIGVLNPRYLQYFEIKSTNQNSSGLFFYFIAFFSIILAMIYRFIGNKIESDRFSAALFSFCLLGVISMCVFHDRVAVGARLGEMFLLPIVILLSWLYTYFAERKMYFHQVILCSLFSIYFVARFLYLFPTFFA